MNIDQQTQDNTIDATQERTSEMPSGYQPMPYEIPENPLTRKRKIIIGFFIFFIILLFGLSIIFFRQVKPKTDSGDMTKLSLTPTKPIGAINTDIYPMATSSAFLEIESSISALAASISAYSAQDPSLSPPVIELSLGF